MGRSRFSFTLLFLLAVLIGMVGVALAVGSVNVPLSDVIVALTGGAPSKPVYATIIVQFRLPRVLTALLAGAGLACAGIQMQTLFRNPLADPYVLGISSGASLGVALVVLAAGGIGGAALIAGLGWLGDLGLAAAASLGAGGALLIVVAASGRLRSVAALLVLGLMFSAFVGAIVSLLMYFSAAERVQAFIRWSFGSFGGVAWRQMAIFAPVTLVGIALAQALVKPLNALLLGETYAQSMGLNLKRARLAVILSAAILAGAVTAFCGPIGFLGIAVPHLCRMLFRTSDHRHLLPTCALIGAMVAILADLIAQMPGGEVVLPLNAVTAVIGAPIVIAIIWRGWERHRLEM
ncbi:MAG TPA: iron ABC transporter permease [Aggregatilineales bacterium]|nr:iron ABC transporter permease [Aggregatilineales bacterium]